MNRQAKVSFCRTRHWVGTCCQKLGQEPPRQGVCGFSIIVLRWWRDAIKERFEKDPAAASRDELAQLASAYLGDPSRRMKLEKGRGGSVDRARDQKWLTRLFFAQHDAHRRNRRATARRRMPSPDELPHSDAALTSESDDGVDNPERNDDEKAQFPDTSSRSCNDSGSKPNSSHTIGRERTPMVTFPKATVLNDLFVGNPQAFTAPLTFEWPTVCRDMSDRPVLC